MHGVGNNNSKAFLAGLVIAAGSMIGCHNDKPHDYGNRRPPVDEITKDERGLGSKDVVSSSDQMATELLNVPELNASKTRWLIVVDNVENQTSSNRFNQNIFLERLKVKLAQLGHGRVQLIENRAKLRELQSKELEPTGGEREDQFGQAGKPAGRPAPGPAGIQPDFSLYMRITDLPNRDTNYYYLTYTLTDLRTREQVWNGGYEVKTER